MKFRKLEFEMTKKDKWFAMGFLEEYTIIKEGKVFQIYSSKNLSWESGESLDKAIEICQEYNNEKLQDYLDRWLVWED